MGVRISGWVTRCMAELSTELGNSGEGEALRDKMVSLVLLWKVSGD